MKSKTLIQVTLTAIILTTVFLASCGGDKNEKKSTTPKIEVKKEVTVDPMQDKGIGPVASVTLGPIDQALADKGKEEFNAKCKACHRINKRYIGPSPKGIMERRSPEWIMNMILNPEEMVQKNAIARKLLMEYSAPMANQNLTQDQARAVLEYFRTLK